MICQTLQEYPFETLKGIGKASGTAFRFMFMGAHMAVENHGEVIGEFLQRRVNFIVSALGSINPTEFSKASQTIDIETELVPYMIDDLNDKVTTAVSAVSGGIWSTREGIMFAGNADRVEEELAEIKEEQAAKNEQIEDKGKKKRLLVRKNYGTYSFSIRKIVSGGFIIDVQLRTSEHRSMYTTRLSIIDVQ